jgi:hypothetical protein
MDVSQKVIGAQEGGAQLGDKLFHRVAFVSPTLLTKRTVEPRSMSRPMR